MDNRQALDPRRSVVVEACAGSGKTWLLVSRIVRLLLDGVQPCDILAITFTRKAAQEMQARLRDWLYALATNDDDFVRQFLRERAVEKSELDDMLPKARSLYQQFLLCHPGLTINTFHGWFMQIVKRSPLDAGMAGNSRLIEQTGTLWDEAQQLFYAELLKAPESEIAQSMQTLFTDIGLSNTQSLLRAFAEKRCEWWAYTAGQSDPLGFSLNNLRTVLDLDPDTDPVANAFADQTWQSAVYAFAKILATGTETQANKANDMLLAWETADVHQRFEMLTQLLYTQSRKPRSMNPTKKQDAETFLLARDILFEKIEAVLEQVRGQNIYRLNMHALRCGQGLLARYQTLKQQQQALDFADLEWRVYLLLNHSPHAEYLQYKLDNRYRHILLDEFQDTNPIQWQILQSWFAASEAVQRAPVIFVVGDPKQSIYRFRRADARLFDIASTFLQSRYKAVYLSQNTTRRNAPAILQAINAVFDGAVDDLARFAGFETHHAHQSTLPGHVEILPLSMGENISTPQVPDKLVLRNPLLEALPELGEGDREMEATQFAEKLLSIVGHWLIRDGESDRRMEWKDIMVLVRRRTHLQIYEHALRARHIPYFTSRRGGLLETLEATDIQALLTFLMTPFANLQLAHTLRSPIFSCSDEDLMIIAREAAKLPEVHRSWWRCLQSLVTNTALSAHLKRAHALLSNWLPLAENLPVHDLLDCVYFEADLQLRYAAAVPSAMHATVLANLQAFMEIALNVDAGRYPSLSGFLRTLAELKQAEDNETPSEGRVEQTGDALRIYTVHEAKGLEAPLVWLLDSNAKAPSDKGFDVLLDWPPDDARPAHLSLYTDKASHGNSREKYFNSDKMLADREDMNLLYVAMTRAKQILIVSGSGDLIKDTWYDRIADVHIEQHANPLSSEYAEQPVIVAKPAPVVPPGLTQPIPCGMHKTLVTEAQRHGIWLHAILQNLAPTSNVAPIDMSVLQQRLNIPADQFSILLQKAERMISQPELQHYFNPLHYHFAYNEMSFVGADGKLKRIDRLVEFEQEVWVLDYKMGSNQAPALHREQMTAYQSAMQTIYPQKTVRCALLFGDGTLEEL